MESERKKRKERELCGVGSLQRFFAVRQEKSIKNQCDNQSFNIYIYININIDR